MKSRVYVWVDGVCFDPDLFNSSLSIELQGTTLSRKKIINGKVESVGRYWKSEVVKVVSDYPEDSLAELLFKLKDELLKIRHLSKIRIVAELVVEYEETDPPRGFFFQKEVIQLLAEIGAHLDIDVVRAVK